MSSSDEQGFIKTFDTLAFSARDPGQALHRLEHWLQCLGDDLQARPLRAAGLNDSHPLAAEAAAINALMVSSRETWARQWEALKPAQVLADTFDDKVILLVFGKFNAGKSSFCNFLAQRFASHGRSVLYFQIDGGRIKEASTPLKEGSTETTAQIQGVVLGEKLLLLDTPGLHSVTSENAALTQRYMDSADGVLWLTSSSSPGQVQELDELARELRRSKPLLPVLTRSDFIDEDEVEGELVKQLCNKSVENRELQESDVHVRAAEKLAGMEVDLAALQPPVSISCHAARAAEYATEAMREAGLERLYRALTDIVAPALHYKQRQPAEMLLHHFEENVLGSVFDETLPRLAELTSALESELCTLEQSKAQLARAVWRSVAPVLPELLETHAAGADQQLLCDELSQLFCEAVEHQTRQLLGGYRLAIDYVALTISLDEDSSRVSPALELATEPQSEDESSRATATEQTVQAAAASADVDRLHTSLEAALRSGLDSISNNIFDQCTAHVENLALAVQDLRDMLQVHAQRLDDVREALRA